jgi:hypothetical protein
MRILIALLTAVIVAGCSGKAATGTEAPTVPPTTSPSTTLTANPTTAIVTPAPTPTPEPTPAGPTQYTPGDLITITSNGEPWATVTITNVKQVAKYSGAYSSDVPAKGNVYIQAFVTYAALTDGVTYGPYDWQVFVGGVAVDSFTFVIYGPKPMLGSGTLPKGRKAEGWLVYEIPKTGKVLLSYGGTFGNQAPVFEAVLRAS